MRARSWGAPGWRPRVTPATAGWSDEERFRALCIEEAGHVVIATKAFAGVTLRNVWANVKTLAGATTVTSWGAAGEWGRMVVIAAGWQGKRKIGAFDQTRYLASEDFRLLQAYSHRDYGLINAAEAEASRLVELYWPDIVRVADALRTRGALSGNDIDQLIGSRATSTAPSTSTTSTTSPGLQTRATSGGQTARQVLR
jgi:hypothetical protein